MENASDWGGHRRYLQDNLKLNGRTFDPNSPRYSGHRSRPIIDDVKPKEAFRPRPQQIEISQSVAQVIPGSIFPQPRPYPEVDNQPTSQPKIEEDIDSLFLSSKEDLVSTPLVPSRLVSQPIAKKEVKWLEISAFIFSLALMIVGLFNKATYHHIFDLILFVNVVIATILLFFHNQVKKLLIIFQSALILLVAAYMITFSLNFMKTNWQYTHNYKEIKNSATLRLTQQQKDSIASDQAEVVTTKDQYDSQYKMFYLATGLVFIYSSVFAILITRKE